MGDGVLPVKQNKLFRHAVLVLILSMAFSAFFISDNVCLNGNEAKASEIGLEQDHPTKPSGGEHETGPHCPNIQSQSEALTPTSAFCRNPYEKQSFQIHARQAAKVGLETPSFSNLLKRDSEVIRAGPSKIFLQNQSFLI